MTHSEICSSVLTLQTCLVSRRSNHASKSTPLFRKNIIFATETLAVKTEKLFPDMNNLDLKNEPESGSDDVPVSLETPSFTNSLGSHLTTDLLDTSDPPHIKGQSHPAVNKESGSQNNFGQKSEIDADRDCWSDGSSDISERNESFAADELEGLSADSDSQENVLPLKREGGNIHASKGSTTRAETVGNVTNQTTFSLKPYHVPVKRKCDADDISSPPKKMRPNRKPTNAKMKLEGCSSETALPKESGSESSPIVFQRKTSRKLERKVLPRLNIKLQKYNHPMVRKKCGNY